jgi:hypothetical protein
MKGGFPANGIPYGCLVPERCEGMLMAGNCISLIPGSTKMGPRLGSYNNLKDIPTMWTTGQAAGTAAALAVQDNSRPRDLSTALLRRQLARQGALFAPEQVAKLESERLPSGRTVKEFYEGQLADMKAYWKRVGE